MNRIGVVTMALAFAATVRAEDEAKPDARDAVDAYIAAVLAGKAEAAMELAVGGRSPSSKEKIEEFKAMVAAKAIKTSIVWSDAEKGQAIAITEQVKLTKAQPDGQDQGHLVVALVKSGDKWLVKDIDVRNEKLAKEQVEKFKQKNADAKELPARSRK